jgi:hypothetical protein
VTNHLQDPFLVFSELLGKRTAVTLHEHFSHICAGVIRGSEEALNHELGFMSREAYERSRSQSTYATQRSTVYSIFESYLKQKRERGDYDAADR